MPSRIRLTSLRTRIITWSFVPTVIILGTVAWVTFIAYQRVAEELVIERNQEVTRLSASQLGAALTEYTDLLEDEAHLIGAHGDRLAEQSDMLHDATDRLVVFDGGTVMLDNLGRLVAAVPDRPEAMGQDWSGRPYFREMLRFPRPTFSDTVSDGPGGKSVIVAAVPIVGDRGQFLGLLAGMFRLDSRTVSAFYGQIVKLRLGQSAGVHLVDSQGRVIYHSEIDHIDEDILQQPMAQQVLQGQVGAMRTRDSDGQPVIASFAPVSGTPWRLIAQERWGTVIGPTRGYQRFLLLLLALGVIVPALVVAGGAKRITTPIKDLIAAAQEVAAGDFGQTITAQTGDELADLAEQFNRMARQLQESYTHLEHRVADRTRELAALNAIALTVSRSLELDEILGDALDKTLEVVGIESGGIYLLDEETSSLTISTHRGFSEEFVAEIDGLKVGEGFSGRAAQTGAPLVIPDVSRDPRLTRMAVKEAGLHSLAIVPLSSRGKVLGTLFAVTRGYREFADQDIQLLTSIGHQIGVAVENARLFEAESKQRQEATLLVEMARLVSSTLDLQEVLQLTAQYAADIFAVDCCCVFLCDEETGTLKPAARIGPHEQVAASIDEQRFRPSAKMQQIVFESRRPLIIEDVGAEPYPSSTDQLDLQSVLVVPIEVKGRILGAIQVGTQRPRRRHFTPDEGELALALANHAAMAIDNARYHMTVQRRADEFRLIAEVGRQIASTLDIDEVLVQVVRLIQRAFNHYHVGIGLVEGDEVHYRVGAGALHDGAFQFIPARLKVGKEGITGWVAGSGEPLLVPDVTQDPRYIWMRGCMTQSELTVPIKAQGQVIGVLDVQSDRLNAFDESDLIVLQSLASQAAIAIENAQHHAQAQQLAVLEERNRLARELHDSVTQSLFSMTLVARAARTLLERNAQQATSHVMRLQELAQGALAEMRSLIFELRPAAVEEVGLASALEKHIAALKSREGLEVGLHLEGTRALTKDQEQGLFRIAQEALNNIVKHAGTNRATVALSLGEEKISLTIDDAGKGFDPAAVGDGGQTMGLESMHERAGLLGGALKIESRVGKGTQVRVEIPHPEGDERHG